MSNANEDSRTNAHPRAFGNDNGLGIVTKTFSFARFWRRRRRLRRTGRRGLPFDVVGIPGEEALEAVLDMRRRSEAVIFAGVNDGVGGAAESLHSLVHLLATENGHVPIDIAAHEKRWRCDVLDMVEGRDSVPDGLMFPGIAQLDLVVALVVVVTVETDEEC